MGATIAVLFHERQPASAMRHYAIRDLAAIWRSWGHDVVPIWGTSTFVPADVLLLHVDLSVVPARYVEFAGMYRVSVNTRLGDIRRSAFSRNGLASHPGWSGQVMVKSDLNCCGAMESLLREPWPGRERGPVLGRPFKRRLYAEPAAVPRRLLDMNDLFAERFVPEPATGCRYATRYHLRFGDRAAAIRQVSREFVVSAKNGAIAGRIDVEPAVEAWSRELGVEYGKLDYVVHDDEPILLDVNKTQGRGSICAYPELMREVIADLAPGIRMYLEA